MKQEYLTTDSGQTREMARILASEILKTPFKKGAFIIGLVGDLGGGKTTFLQGFSKGLKIKEKILSPTFVIMKRFKLSKSKVRFQNFYHFDCYRIEKAKEILDLGFKEIIAEPKNIVAIEWAEKVKKLLPRDTIWINFSFINKKTRKIVVK